MSWHFIVQPDGLLARFTDEDQDFIDFALTETEALEMCGRAGIGPERARRMVRSRNPFMPGSDRVARPSPNPMLMRT